MCDIKDKDTVPSTV